MKPAPIPENESARLQSLRAHRLLDTLPEDVYDDITKIASEICGTPIASLTLVDENRLWFKSKQGIMIDEIPREESFCAHTIMYPNDVFVVPDARYDERFNDNPSVQGDPGIAFYAGVPVKGADGFPFGSICVMDTRPRTMPEGKLDSLKALADLVNVHFRLRKIKMDLAAQEHTLESISTLVQTMKQEVAALKKETLPTQQAAQVQALENALLELGIIAG